MAKRTPIQSPSQPQPKPHALSRQEPLAPEGSPPAQRVETIRDLLWQHREQIEAALPRFLSAERLIRVTVTALTTTPKLAECYPASLLGAVLQCAQLGLEPGILGQAYLVPFWNGKRRRMEVQIIPGYKGLLELARRSGQIASIMAHAVYERDEFDYAYGLEPRLVHRPSRATDRGRPIFYYAIAKLKDGSYQFEVMSQAEVEEHRRRYSKAADSGPWVTNPEEMALKTALRRLCKLLPASIELQAATALDEYQEHGLPQGLASLAGDLEPEPADAATASGARQDEAADELADVHRALAGEEEPAPAPAPPPETQAAASAALVPDEEASPEPDPELDHAELDRQILLADYREALRRARQAESVDDLLQRAQHDMDDATYTAFRAEAEAHRQTLAAAQASGKRHYEQLIRAAGSVQEATAAINAAMKDTTVPLAERVALQNTYRQRLKELSGKGAR